MLKHITKRTIRQPVSALAVILFAAVLTVVLCYLHRAEQEEIRSYENTYRSVPIHFQVTNLDGSKIDKSDPVDGWFAELFFPDSRISPNFSELASDLQLRMSHPAFLGNTAEEDAFPNEELTGITSLFVAQELTMEHGADIHWKTGYDESIFASDRLLCVVPESDGEMEEVVLTFRYHNRELQIHREYRCTLTVVGWHTDSGNYGIYCPYAVMEQIYLKLGESKKFEHISATLKDNHDLALLRDTAAHWFAQPNPLGELTAWGKYGYDHYLYAMDINDTLLKNLQTNLKNSIRINQLAAMLVFLLSAGAGFFTGFLVIRSRKREINLMRTLGASNAAVCFEFGIEQAMYVVVGIILGGSYSLWTPMNRLCIFAGIYIAGLTAALITFIKTNLLATIKEDE